MLNRKNLRIALARHGKTLKDLARITGIDLLRLYRITSKQVLPTKEELQVLATALELDPGDLEVR